MPAWAAGAWAVGAWQGTAWADGSSPPPTPTAVEMAGGGSGFTHIRHKPQRRRDKEEIRQKLETAINGLQDVPAVAAEVAEIKREHQAPRPKAAKKQPPRIDWESLLADAKSVEYLLREYEALLALRKRQQDDDDDEDALMALMH